MKAKVIETEGYSLEAIVEINGEQFHAMDDISEPDNPIKSGEEVEIEISTLCLEDESWEQIFNGNPQKKKCLERTVGWSYKAFGEIIQINPVIIDCNIIKLENEIQTNDDRCIGEFVSITISRLDITKKV